MGLYKQYFRLTQRARSHLLGISSQDPSKNGLPIQMLISQHFSHGRLSVIVIGLFTLAIGIILSSIPWLDYVIVKNLKLREGSISFHYWQKPGVIRLTKVYIFNVSNPDGFLKLGEKPKLQEIGPFVYKEDMEKVNIKFHDNGTVSYQHKKILKFVPELSVDRQHRITVPNIPLLTLSSQSNNLGYWVQKTISLLLSMGSSKPFINVTADELVFGYDDNLVALAHRFYPKRKKPSNKMGLLISRNGTLAEVHNMYTGDTGMQEFGLLANLNGKQTLPYWSEEPCNVLSASEGSFFPPRYFTKRDLIYLYDKDICRTLPMQYRESGEKHGIAADLYTPPDNIFDDVKANPDNKCYCPGNEYCPPKGLQNISPCQYDAPVYLSFPHFLDADPSLINEVEGLKPDRNKHQSYFRIQPGIDDLTPPIRRWMYLATTFADVACPLMTYGFIIFGSCLIIAVFVNAYKSIMFTKKTIEIGMKNLRRSSLLITSNRFISRRETYTLLDFQDVDADGEV